MSEQHPMRPVEFLVLAVLAERDQHGYGIVRQIERRTGGRVRIAPGNLYRVLDRMLHRGLLAEADRRADEDLGTERRRYYAITPPGRKALAEEARLLGDVVDEVRASVSVPSETTP